MALPVEVVQKLRTKKRDRKGWSDSELFQTLERQEKLTPWAIVSQECLDITGF